MKKFCKFIIFVMFCIFQDNVASQLFQDDLARLLILDTPYEDSTSHMSVDEDSYLRNLSSTEERQEKDMEVNMM